MTGESIRHVRREIRMEPAQFAQLLGVHPSTLYRWENAGATQVRVEPLQRQLLTVLEQQLAERSSLRARAELSETILKGLLIGGGLLGLFYLLNAAFGGDGMARRAPGLRAAAASTPETTTETDGREVGPTVAEVPSTG